MEVETRSDQMSKDTEDTESMEEFRARLTDAIGQMMFVSGETAEPSAETTTLIEEIVRQQVIEMVPSRLLVLAFWMYMRGRKLLILGLAHAQHCLSYPSR